MLLGFRLPGNAAKSRILGGSYLDPSPGTWSPANSVANRIRWQSNYSDFPVGEGAQALIRAMKDGGIRATLTGSNNVSGAAIGLGEMAGTLTGSNTVTVPAYGLTALRQLAATLTGTNSLSAAINGRGGLRASIKTAELSQTEVEGAILDAVVESGVSLRQALRLLLAVAAGKTDITDLGGGNATVKFRDVNDTKDRVTASMTGSERTSVTKDAS